MPSELSALKVALDHWVSENPVVRRYQILNAAQILEVLDLARQFQAKESATAPAPEKPPTPIPAELMDYFARDRKGNVPKSAPAGATLQTVRIQGTTESVDRKHLKVIYAGGKANCFDRELWPRIVRQSGQDAQLWILESGNFLNIVGVRA